MKAILLAAALAVPLAVAQAQEALPPTGSPTGSPTELSTELSTEPAPPAAGALDAPDELEAPAQPAAEVAPSVLPPPPALGGSSVLLEAWLERRAMDESMMRVTTAVTALSAGLALAGLSTWILADEAFAGAGYGRVAVGAMGIVLSALAVGLATYQLAVPSVAEGRWARYTAGPRDPRELARFEGELRAEAEAARRERFTVLVIGASSMAASLGFLITTAALDSGLTDADRLFGYTTAGTLGALGLALTILSLFDSPAENAWRSVEAGTLPRAATRVLPWASAQGGGLLLTGAL